MLDFQCIFHEISYVLTIIHFLITPSVVGVFGFDDAACAVEVFYGACGAGFGKNLLLNLLYHASPHFVNKNHPRKRGWEREIIFDFNIAYRVRLLFLLRDRSV